VENREFTRRDANRGNLKEPEEKRIRDLRDDPDRRPWVRMAALDTLMEIEREKDTQARENKEAEEKAKKGKTSPSEDK
jgi:hypothetical protein